MDSTPVKVNVGGRIFTTTRGVLQKAKYFQELSLDADLGEQLIDRDPDIFAYLLNCLRDRRYINPERISEYGPDIDYYAMDCLREEVKEQTPVITVKNGSTYYVEDWHGVPVIKTKEAFLTSNTLVKLKGVTVTLPFTGVVELEEFRTYNGPGNRLDATSGQPVALELYLQSGVIDKGDHVCILRFHRVQPYVIKEAI